MKDGAHTHGHGRGGVGVAAIGAGVLLAIGLAEVIVRIWPYLLAGVAVIAGLWAGGRVTLAVAVYRQQQAAWQAQVTGARHASLRDQEIAALRQAVEDLHARLATRQPSDDQPGLEYHEHVHFHGLAAGQIAAALAARQHAQPDDGGGPW